MFVLMISRWSLELGHLWRLIHGPLTSFSFSVHVSFSVTIGPTEWYLARVKCLCLGQFLSNYCSYSQWYLVHAYILAWPLECSHPYLTLTYFTVHWTCYIVILVNTIIMNFGHNVFLDQFLVRFCKYHDTQVSVTGPSWPSCWQMIVIQCIKCEMGLYAVCWQHKSWSVCAFAQAEQATVVRLRPELWKYHAPLVQLVPFPWGQVRNFNLLVLGQVSNS